MAHFAGWWYFWTFSRFLGILGTPWGHPWGSGSVARSMGGQENLACILYYIEHFQEQYLAKVLFLLQYSYIVLIKVNSPKCYFCLLYFCSELSLSLECYWPAQNQPKIKPKISPKLAQNQPKTCTNLKLC
jgi:hypothetical protein